MNPLKKSRLLIVFGLLLFVIPILSYAILPSPCGLYIDAGVGIPNLQNKHYPGPNSTPSSWMGWNAEIGYKFIPFLAAELGYTNYYGARNYDVRIFNTASNQAGIVRHYAIDAVIKGIFPLGKSGLELFAKGGVSAMNSQIIVTNGSAANSIGLSNGNNTAFGPYIGVGANFFFAPAVAGIIQWARAQGNDKTANGTMYSAGLMIALS